VTGDFRRERAYLFGRRMMKMMCIIDGWEAGGSGGGGADVGMDWMDCWSELDEMVLRGYISLVALR
jgi:hypothetical protein